VSSQFVHVLWSLATEFSAVYTLSADFITLALPTVFTSPASVGLALLSSDVLRRTDRPSTELFRLANVRGKSFSDAELEMNDGVASIQCESLADDAPIFRRHSLRDGGGAAPIRNDDVVSCAPRDELAGCRRSELTRETIVSSQFVL